MADDPENYLPVPASQASPAMLQAAWAQALRNQQNREAPKFAGNWAGAVAGVLTGLNEARQQKQLNEFLRGGAGGGGSGASTVPSLPDEDNGAELPAAGHPDQPLTDKQYGPNPPGVGAALDPAYVNTAMQIESGGDVNAQSGSNRGLFQWSPDLERKYGINDSNRTNPDAQRDAFERANKDYAGYLNKAGVDVTPSNLYLTHQQGVGGGPALLKADPNKPAWQVLNDIGVPAAKAKASITGNLWPGMPGYGLPADQVTAGTFRGAWNDKVNRGIARYGGGQPGGGSVPVPGQAAPPAAPPGQVGQSAAGSAGAGATFPGSPAPGGQAPQGPPAASASPLGGSTDPAARAEPAGPTAPAPGGFMPADARARQEYAAAATRAQQLKRYPVWTPEHQEGVRLEEELQKQRLAPPTTVTNPATGESQYYSPLTGGRASGLPRQMTPGEIETAKTTGAKLAEARVKPVGEAIERGTTAQKEVALLNNLDVLNSRTSNFLSGPFAGSFVEIGKGLKEVSGGMLGWDTAGAEGIEKMNYSLASLAAREITNRPALAEFRSMINSNPGLGNSKEGRAMLIDIIRQGAQQDVQLSRLASRVEDPRQWADIRDKFYDEHPINITYAGKNYTTDKAGMAALKDAATPPPTDTGFPANPAAAPSQGGASFNDRFSAATPMLPQPPPARGPAGVFSNVNPPEAEFGPPPGMTPKGQQDYLGGQAKVAPYIAPAMAAAPFLGPAASVGGTAITGAWPYIKPALKNTIDHAWLAEILKYLGH